MKYTIKDVADRARVSVATVSRVLNHSDTVKEETRDRVVAVIEELSYTPNFAAKRMRRDLVNTIGVIVPDISASFYSEIIKGIENRANEMSFRLIVCDAQNSKLKEKDHIRFLYDGSVDGMVFVVPQVADDDLVHLHSQSMSIVVFGRNMGQYGIPSITVDNVYGAYQAVKHLCSHGFTKIAYIGGIEAENDYDHRARLHGFKTALSDAGIGVRDGYIENGAYSEEGGSSAFLRLMSLAEPPTAIFCANDEMALGVLRAAKKRGVDIPRQLSLIGFDNIRISQYTSPALTTVSQPTYNIGVLLGERLISNLTRGGKARSSANLILRPELIVRESCGC